MILKLNNNMYQSWHVLCYTLYMLGCVVNQRIRMISEGSCDTEDWSNDAENSGIHNIWKYSY